MRYRSRSSFQLFLIALLLAQGVTVILQIVWKFERPLWLDIILLMLILIGFVFDPRLKEWTKDSPTIIGREDR